MKLVAILLIFLITLQSYAGRFTTRKAVHGSRRSKVTKLRLTSAPPSINNTLYNPADNVAKTENGTTILTPKQVQASYYDENLKSENENTTRGEKKGSLENAQKRVELRPKIIDQKEDEEKQKKSADGSVGQSGASNLRRIYAANEVAEINRLLGKPLTDAKALGLIKNLLLDRVHTHLAKTMETNQILDPNQNSETTATANGAIVASAANSVNTVGNTMFKDGIHGVSPAVEQIQVCHDQDPKEKCLYLKDLGLCNEFGSHPHIRRRCSETCNLCEQPVALAQPVAPCQEECHETVCAGCATAALAAPPAPLPPPQPIILQPPVTTPLPCPVTCALPAPTVAVVPVQPCPTQCIRRRTTQIPVIIRRTTPHPVVLLADNTPMPHLRVATPTLQLRVLTANINCGEIVAVRRPTCPTLCPPRPTLCPPVIRPSPTVAAIIDAVTDMHLPLVQPTQIPLVRPTTFLPILRRRTTFLPPLLHRHSTPLPLLPTGRIIGGGLPLHGIGGITPFTKCSSPIDIGLAVDSSAAVVPHWAQMQNFLKSLVDRFQMNGVCRIGLIQFDTIAKMPVHLDSYNEPIALKQHIMKLTPDPYGRRRTDAALDMAKEKLFAAGRSGIPKMLFVVEHGKVNGGDPSINWSQLLVDPAQKLKDAGVNVFAVGTTPIATVDELKTIGGDQSHVIPLQSYGQLQGVVPQIAKKACQLAGSARNSSPSVVKDECSTCENNCPPKCSNIKQEQGMA